VPPKCPIMEKFDTSITRLRRIALQLSGDDGRWFRECLELYQAGARDGLRLDVCLGLIPERGRTPWWESESCVERDQIVRGIAAKYCAGMRTTHAARWIVGQAFIYETGEYRFHRKLMAPPAAIEGTVRADLFRLLKAHGRTRGASCKVSSPSYATILRALKKIMKSLFLRNIVHDKKA
jgi:hypothetical protein